MGEEAARAFRQGGGGREIERVGGEEGHGEGGGRADGGDRVQLDVSFHEVRKGAGDGETEAGAAKEASGGVVALLEGAEEIGEDLFLDADARVFDHEDDAAAFFRVDGGHGQLDEALLGEFDGVADEVGEDLADAAGVADEAEVAGEVEHAGEFDGLLRGGIVHDFPKIGDEGGEVEFNVFEGDLARLDLGEVQDVVDDHK